MARTVPVVAQDDIAAVADHVQGGVKAGVAHPILAAVAAQGCISTLGQANPCEGLVAVCEP